MKVLFLSDIHGIYENLEHIEKVIKKEKIEKMVVLGDLYYGGPTYFDSKQINSLFVHDFLTKYSDILICMKGNCDSDVDIKASDFPICRDLSMIHTDDIDIYLTHGNEYNKEKNKKFNKKGVLVYGHEHIPYIEKIKDMIYINVGSISLPRGDNLPSYLVFNDKEFIIYDILDNIISEFNI